MKKFSIIVALDQKSWIWKNWKLAWSIWKDIKFFKEITSKTTDANKQNAVVMWRTTWESIPKKFKPLSKRLNIVLSRNINTNIKNWVIIKNSFEQALEFLDKMINIENIFIIWWEKLYNTAINSKYLDKIYITQVFWNFNCDTFFPKIDKFKKIFNWDIQEENWIKFRFCEFILNPSHKNNKEN